MLSLTTELKAEMARRDYDIGQLAQAIGLTRPTLSQRLNGHKDFKYEELVNICKILKVSLSELVRRAEEAQTQKETA